MSSTINAVADKAEIIATEHHEMMSTDKGGDIPDKGIPVGDSEKRRLSRRISIHLIPMLAIVYSFSVIDRVNIGQAKVVGMTEDLSMHGSAPYSVCLLVFFPAYMIAELPGNMALVKFGVAKTLAFLMLALGVSTLAQGHTKHWGVLAFCRVLVGAFEASIFPACIYLISSWYVRYEAHKMLAILYSIGLVASSFAGVLAYALALLEGHAGWLGWRWIFTIEGAVTAAFAIPTYFFIVDFPDRATFLSQREREIRMQELNEDRGDAATSQVTLKNLKDLKDWTIWLVTFMYLCNVCMVYGLAFYVPSILVGLGYSGLQANLYSAPPYLVAVGFLLLSSYFADRMQRRLPLVIIQGCIGIVGLAMISQLNLSPETRYAGTCLAIAACQSNNSAILIFGQNNVVGSSKRSVASVLNIAGGTIGGLLGSTIYLQKEAPTYTTGLGVTMALQACLIITSIAAWAKLSSYNRAADNERAVFNGAESWRWTL